MQVPVGRMFEAKGEAVVKAQVRCAPDISEKEQGSQFDWRESGR